MISFANTSGPFMKSISENGILYEDKMKYESHRLGSFCSWRHYDKARPLILAKFGFYSTDEKSDSVTCFSCGAQKSHWTYRSDIESEHRQLNPECLHIRGQDETNVPILIPDKDISAEIWRQLHIMYCGDVSDTGALTAPVNRIDAINNVNHDATQPTQPSVNRADSSNHYSKQHNKYHLTDSREAKLRSEEERLRTFKDGWPHRLPTPADLAKEGFFFTQVADRVQCIFCNGILKNWEVTDNPSVEHQKHFPGCGFVRKRDVGNIPRRFDIQSELGVTQVLNDDRIEVLRLDVGSPSTGIVTEPPRHPQYATEASRIASFTTWPKGLSQTPQMLAKAGFFYAGFDDSVKCFYCDGGLRTWEANDDPWKEHAKWFSKCPYVLQVKGEDFIQRQKRETSDSASSQTEEREITARLDLPAVQRVLDMDIPRERVKLVIRDRLNRTGDDFDSAEDLLNALYHLGDSNQVMPAPITNSSRHSTLPPPVPTLTVDQSQIGRESSELNKMSLGDTESSADHESLLLENQRLKDQRTCKICMDEEANIVLLPCGHLVSCATCAPALRKCPICRAGIKGTVRTYLS